MARSKQLARAGIRRQFVNMEKANDPEAEWLNPLTSTLSSELGGSRSYHGIVPS